MVAGAKHTRRMQTLTAAIAGVSGSERKHASLLVERATRDESTLGGTLRSVDCWFASDIPDGMQMQGEWTLSLSLQDRSDCSSAVNKLMQPPRFNSGVADAREGGMRTAAPCPPGGCTATTAARAHSRRTESRLCSDDVQLQ